MGVSLRVATLAELYNYNRFPLVGSKGSRKRSAYGRAFPEKASDLDIEMWCSGKRLSVSDGGLGEGGHFKRVLQLLYPYLIHEWTHWLDMQVECLCSPSGTCTFLGGGGIGKSFFFGTGGRLWQACDPERRGVMIINTTQKTQSERAWKYVIDCQQNFPFLPGIITESSENPKLSIYKKVPNPRNPKRFILERKPGVGIISQTVKKGSSAQATADLKGLHPPELLILIEEANHLKRSSLERARANWITNNYYKIVMGGNPEIEDSEDANKEDALYHFSQPVHGWKSINWGETKQWENKFGGTTYHFDPYDSPAVREPARFKVSSWLPTQEFINRKARELGGENTPLFKQQIRGIYDYASLPFNLITLGMCDRFSVRSRANFTGFARQRWAGFDPAYSGTDEAFLKIAESGMTEDGRVEIDFMGDATNFVFKIDSDCGVEPSFQMLNWVKSKLIEWKVPPKNLMMDANLIGIGLGDIMTAFLSPEINKISIMGAPSDRFVDLAGTVKASERCFNKAAELWYAFQQLMITSQIKGLDDSIIDQLIEMPAHQFNKKIKIMEKKDFRKKYGYSPDRAECCLFIVDLLRHRGFQQGFKKGEEPAEFAVESVEESRVLSIEDVFMNMAPKPYMEGSREEMLSRSYKEIEARDGIAELSAVIRAMYKTSDIY